MLALRGEPPGVRQLYSRPLQAAAGRALIANRLKLAGTPQMILQIGPARPGQVTARHPPADLIDP